MLQILPSYKHIINPKLKYIYLSFDEDGGLIIKSPKVTQSQIEKLLIKKAGWITKSRQKLLAKKGKSLRFEEGEEIYFMGEAFPLRLDISSHHKFSLNFTMQDGFSITTDSYDPDYFQQRLDRFYKMQALEIVPDLVEYYSAQMQLFPSKLSFRKAKTRWGSCSNKNSISLNYRMMKLPLDIIKYIIVHELAHIEHKDHQKKFWQLVASIMPSYKAYENELKTYHP